MFGISWGEFLVIMLVGVIVIPTRYWPDVARWIGRAVRAIREFIWRISDASENIKSQIDLERPLDEMISETTDSVLDAFSQLCPPQKQKKNTKKSPKVRS